MKYRKLMALAIIGSFSLSRLSSLVYAEDTMEIYTEETVQVQENDDIVENTSNDSIEIDIEEAQDEQTKTISESNNESNEDSAETVIDNNEMTESEETDVSEDISGEVSEQDSTEETEETEVTDEADVDHEHHYSYEKYSRYYHKKVCEDGDYEKVEKCVDENNDNICDMCGNDIEDISSISSSVTIEVKHSSTQTTTVEYEGEEYEIELQGDYYTSDITELSTSKRCNFEDFISAAHDLENEDLCLYTGNIDYTLFNDLIGIDDLYAELSEYESIPTDMTIVIFERDGEIQEYTIETEDNYVPSDDSGIDEVVEYEHDYSVKKNDTKEVAQESSDSEVLEDTSEDVIDDEILSTDSSEDFTDTDEVVDDQSDIPLESNTSDNEQKSESSDDIKIDEAAIPESIESEEDIEE